MNIRHLKFFMIFLSLTIAGSTNDRLDIIAKYLPEDPVVLEAGAHNGRDTLKMAKLWPKGRIYAFEPNKIVFEKLVERVKHVENVLCFPIALGNRNGEQTFYQSSPKPNVRYEFDAQSSLLEPNLRDTMPWVGENINFDKVIVPVKKLKSWVRENKVDKIDFMWLDMQGFEWQMLSQAGPILNTVKVIKTEYSLEEFYKGVVLLPKLQKWLEKRGFRLLTRDGGNHGDAIFVRD